MSKLSMSIFAFILPLVLVSAARASDPNAEERVRNTLKRSQNCTFSAKNFNDWTHPIFKPLSANPNTGMFEETWYGVTFRLDTRSGEMTAIEYNQPIKGQTFEIETQNVIGVRMDFKSEDNTVSAFCYYWK